MEAHILHASINGVDTTHEFKAIHTHFSRKGNEKIFAENAARHAVRRLQRAADRAPPLCQASQV
eukprot:6187680-Pleurochrysis_carterae.AAC.2